jgi:hypothetical protein
MTWRNDIVLGCSSAACSPSLWSLASTPPSGSVLLVGRHFASPGWTWSSSCAGAERRTRLEIDGAEGHSLARADAENTMNYSHSPSDARGGNSP